MQEFYDQRTLISHHWFPFREPDPYTCLCNYNAIIYILLKGKVFQQEYPKPHYSPLLTSDQPGYLTALRQE